jgi:hypothetical protein
MPIADTNAIKSRARLVVIMDGNPRNSLLFKLDLAIYTMKPPITAITEDNAIRPDAAFKPGNVSTWKYFTAIDGGNSLDKKSAAMTTIMTESNDAIAETNMKTDDLSINLCISSEYMA